MSKTQSPTLKRKSFETVLLVGASGSAAAISLLTAYLTLKFYSAEDFVEFYKVLLLVQILRPLMGLKLDQIILREENKIHCARMVLKVSFFCFLIASVIGLSVFALGFGTSLIWAAPVAFMTMLLEMSTNLLTLQSRLALVVIIRVIRPTAILLAQLGFVSQLPAFGLELGYLLGVGLAAAWCVITADLWRVKRFRRRELCSLFLRNKTLVLNLAPAGALLQVAKAMPFYIIQAVADAEIAALIALVLRYADGIGGLVHSNVRLIYMKYFDRTTKRRVVKIGVINKSMYGAIGVCAFLALATPSLSIQALSGAAAFYYVSRLALLPLGSQNFFDRREYIILADSIVLSSTYFSLYGLQTFGIFDFMQRPESLFMFFAVSNIFYLIVMRPQSSFQ